MVFDAAELGNVSTKRNPYRNSFQSQYPIDTNPAIFIMPSILLLASTERPEDRADDAVAAQLAAAEIVAARLTAAGAGDITSCFPTAGDADQIDSADHTILSSLQRTDSTAALKSFDALVVVPPSEDSSGPLHPFAAEAIGHFMEEEKFFALCSGTTIALRWLLPPDTVGMYQPNHIPTDDQLPNAVNAHFA